ncbi:MAG: lactonase family protein [Planctomycetaceae bacterium]|nr:lactonase family protein [Planctomycetaceae bacterium]
MRRLPPFLLLTFLLLSDGIARAEEHRLYVGTYTRGDSQSEGIYTAIFDDQTGQLSGTALAAKADNPSFLAIHPTRPLLFACIETNDYEDQPTGAVAAYQRSENGQLTLLNMQPSGGGAPCHCNIDATGRFLLVANYLGGNTAVFPIGEDGHLGSASCTINHIGSGPNKSRQEAPHAHSVNLSADNRFAYVADLGIDRIMTYRFDSRNGRLVPSAVPATATVPGGGPRHFALHPSGKLAFTNNELTCQITSFQRDPQSGRLSVIGHFSTLPNDFDGRKSTAECLVHPSGKFLYVSNRGHESIAVYSIDESSGRLTRLEIVSSGGREPRNFRLTADGKWLLAENQNSDSIQIFRVLTNGTLQPHGPPVNMARPVCIRFVE